MYQTCLSDASRQYHRCTECSQSAFHVLSSLFVICPLNWHPASQQETLPGQILFHVLSLVMAFAARLDWFISSSSFTLDKPSSPLLAYLTWGASGGEMPGTWERFNCWAGHWSNRSTPGVLKACLELRTPLWPPENEVKTEKSKIAISFWRWDVLGVFCIPIVCKTGVLRCLERMQSISLHTSDLC